MGIAITFLQVGSCGFALLHGTTVVGDGPGSRMDPFVFCTHTNLVSCGACGGGATTYDVSIIAAFPCLGTHSWLLPW